MGRQWGLIPIFLPEFNETFAAEIEPTQGLMALLLQHNVNIWPIWCNTEIVNQALAMLDDFDYNDAEFISYFNKEPIASTSLTQVYISGYVKQNGSTLMIVSNLSQDQQVGEICLNNTLTRKIDKVRSWPDKKQLAINQDQCFHVSIDLNNYKMFVID